MVGISKGAYSDDIVEGTEDFIEVLSSSTGGWDWSSFDVYYSPRARRYFWYEDSGCSCSGPMDVVDSLADFEHGDREALLRAWSRWGGGGGMYDGLSVDEKAHGIQTIRNYREVPFRG